MKTRHLLIVVVLIVAAIAISLTYKLFVDREQDQPAPLETGLVVEKRDVVSFFDDISEIKEITVRDGEKSFTFSLGEEVITEQFDSSVPSQMNTQLTWRMSDPFLKEPNEILIARMAKKFLDLSGSVWSKEEIDDLGFDQGEQIITELMSPRFSITYRSADDICETIFVTQAGDNWQDCYAVRETDDEIVRISGLFPLLTLEPAHFLQKDVSVIPREAVSTIRLIRSDDELDLLIKRITDPQRADEIAATIMRQNEQGASINESEETTSPDAEVTTTPTTSEVNSEEYSDNDHLPATETGHTELLTTDEGDTDLPVFFELKTDAMPADWQIISPLEIHANGYNVSSLVQEITELEAREFVALGETQFPLYGLDQPRYQCVVQGLDINGQVRSDTLLFGEYASSEDIYAYSSLLDAVFLCSRGSIRSLDTPLEDFIDQFPVRLPLYDVRYMDVLTPLQTVSCRVNRDETGLMTEIFVDDIYLDWSPEKGLNSLRQLYRGITDIQVSGVDLVAPASEEILYKIVIQSVNPVPAGTSIAQNDDDNIEGEENFESTSNEVADNDIIIEDDIKEFTSAEQEEAFVAKKTLHNRQNFRPW